MMACPSGLHAGGESTPNVENIQIHCFVSLSHHLSYKLLWEVRVFCCQMAAVYHSDG
uniref:Uncharacterized protein n=1 Tax=Anguilla anguilla TaxID=7936 RepID=A0A0E9S9U3_ANGAN